VNIVIFKKIHGACYNISMTQLKYYSLISFINTKFYLKIFNGTRVLHIQSMFNNVHIFKCLYLYATSIYNDLHLISMATIVGIFQH